MTHYGVMDPPVLEQSLNGVVDVSSVQNKESLLITIPQYEDRQFGDHIIAYANEIPSSVFNVPDDSHSLMQIKIDFSRLPDDEYNVGYVVYDLFGNNSTSRFKSVKIIKSPGVGMIVKTVNHIPPVGGGNVDTVDPVRFFSEDESVSSNFLSGKTWIFRNSVQKDVSLTFEGILPSWSMDEFSIQPGVYANIINSTDNTLVIKTVNAIMDRRNVVYSISLDPGGSSVTLLWAGDYWYPIYGLGGSTVLDLTSNYDWTGQHTFSQAPISTALFNSLNNDSLVTQSQVKQLIKMEVKSGFNNHEVHGNDTCHLDSSLQHMMLTLQNTYPLSVIVNMDEGMCAPGYILSLRADIGVNGKPADNTTCNVTFGDTNVRVNNGTSKGPFTISANHGLDLTWTGDYWI